MYSPINYYYDISKNVLRFTINHVPHETMTPAPWSGYSYNII